MSRLLQVSPHQHNFNEACAKQLYPTKGAVKHMYIDPDDPLTSGCKPEIIGLGRYNHFSPYRQRLRRLLPKGVGVGEDEQVVLSYCKL